MIFLLAAGNSCSGLLTTSAVSAGTTASSGATLLGLSLSSLTRFIFLGVWV